jgi:hypothetical protein
VTWLLVGGLVWLPPLARHLGHAPPTARGMLCAALAFPLVILADTLWKWRQAARIS